MNNSASSAPPGPKPSPDEIAETRTLLRVFMLLLLGTLISSNLPLPWKVLGLLFGLGTLTVGLIALVNLVRHKAPALLRAFTTVGLVTTLFLVLGTGAAILLWPVTERYETCMSRALTSAAERQCEDDLRNLGGLLQSRPMPATQEEPWSTSSPR